MKNEIEVQRSFWNSEADAFERIYSHEKSKLSTALDHYAGCALLPEFHAIEPVSRRGLRKRAL